MNRVVGRAISVIAAVAALPIVAMATSYADPVSDQNDYLFGDTMFFALAPGIDCSINAVGDVGCDLNPPLPMFYYWAAPISLPGPVRQVIADRSFPLPHPGFVPGTPFTMPGGNPAVSPAQRLTISHGGTNCRIVYEVYCQGPGGKLAIQRNGDNYQVRIDV